MHIWKKKNLVKWTQEFFIICILLWICIRVRDILKFVLDYVLNLQKNCTRVNRWTLKFYLKIYVKAQVMLSKHQKFTVFFFASSRYELTFFHNFDKRLLCIYQLLIQYFHYLNYFVSKYFTNRWTRHVMMMLMNNLSSECFFF